MNKNLPHTRRVSIRTFLLCLIAVALSLQAYAAPEHTDTFRVLQYNLLNYGSPDNPTSYKGPRLKTILEHARPDIFGANEITGDPSYVQHILDHVLGAGWSHAGYQNTGRQSLVNMVFWRSDKFALKERTLVSHIVRDINAYRLYYLAPDLALTRDTVFLTVIVAHLKAGNTFQDRETRASEAMTIASYINSLGREDNYLVMGDFNLYSNTETAFTNLTAGPHPIARMQDPANRLGAWSGNPEFSDVHTQSTRRISLSDGGAGGGMDDRFDFILASSSVIQQKLGIRYIPGTYHALGQDGKRMNEAVNATSPVNTSAPAQVIQALYEMSDHLPVISDFTVTTPEWTSVPEKETQSDLTVRTPFDRTIRLIPGSAYAGNRVRIRLSNMMGAVVLEEVHQLPAAAQILEIKTDVPPGLYLLYITDGRHPAAVRKLVRQ